MAAFSGHTEDGDELFGRRFSVAYSHVGMRWWGKRGEDGLSPVVYQRRGAFPSPPVKMQRLNFFKFFCTSLGNEGDTYLPLPSPICSHPRSWKLLLPRFNSSPWSQERMCLPLLCHTSFFDVCFLTFMSNSFHKKRGMEKEKVMEKDEGMENKYIPCLRYCSNIIKCNMNNNIITIFPIFIKCCTK